MTKTAWFVTRRHPESRLDHSGGRGMAMAREIPPKATHKMLKMTKHSKKLTLRCKKSAFFFPCGVHQRIQSPETESTTAGFAMPNLARSTSGADAGILSPDSRSVNL